MIEKLITDFFNKVEKVEGITSRNGKAKFLVEELLEKKHEKFNYISIQTASRLHKKFVEKSNNENVTTSDPFLKNVIAEYLDYSNYKHFTEENYLKDEFEKESEELNQYHIYSKDHNSNGKQNIEEKNSNFLKSIFNNVSKAKKYKKHIITVILSLFSFIGINYSSTFLNSGNYIKWNNDRFKKTFSTDENAIDNTIYKINIEKFRKVVLDSSYTFFTNGHNNYWYGKNYEGVREFFTDRGIHPETKKELKPITRDILAAESLLYE